MTATSVNAAGQVTGFSTTAGDMAQIAFLYQDGTTISLGTLGGTFSQASAINAAGQVAGTAFTENNAESHAFRFTGETMLDLDTLGGASSMAFALNDSGEVAGESSTSDNRTHAFVFRAGAMIDLGIIEGGSSSSAVAINNNGEVAGNSSTGNFQTHAFLHSGDTLHDLGTLGGNYSFAAGLNNLGHVVGDSAAANRETHAFLYRDGIMHDLGTLGGTYSAAYAVNDASIVIGDSSTAGDAEFHGFVYTGGVMTDVGTLGGSYSTIAAVNSLGQVVGDSATDTGISHAFLYQNGELIDLNSLLPADSGWVLYAALLINDAGQIVGFGDYRGQFSWYFLSLSADNQAPVADAGSNQTVACAGGHGQALLDGTGSSDPDGDVLTFEWFEGSTPIASGGTATVNLSPGTHTLTLQVSDPAGLTATASVVIEVVDSESPTLSGPSTLAVSATSECQALVPDVRPHLLLGDNCASIDQLVITQTPAAGTLVPVGAHTITVTATDNAGNFATTTLSLVVADVTAPVIRAIKASPAVLSPANHQMVPVTVAVESTDNCDAAPLCRIVSVTGDDGAGEGGKPDWTVTGDLTLELRAERSAKAEKRTYTITVSCTDASGNVSLGTVTVIVSKEKTKTGGNPK